MGSVKIMMLDCSMNSRKAPAPRPYHHGDLRRALIGAALAIAAEEQNWSFSLREVARRAGVSHNAPYNHFPERRDLLAAVAAVGFDRLRIAMRAALARAHGAESALLAIGQAYVAFAVKNPALYRLMFGPELLQPHGVRPAPTEAADAVAKLVLHEVIAHGAESGQFALPASGDSVGMAALAAWSAVHGLAMLIIDNKTSHPGQHKKLAQGVIAHLVQGLRWR